MPHIRNDLFYSPIFFAVVVVLVTLIRLYFTRTHRRSRRRRRSRLANTLFLCRIARLSRFWWFCMKWFESIFLLFKVMDLMHVCEKYSPLSRHCRYATFGTPHWIDLVYFVCLVLPLLYSALSLALALSFSVLCIITDTQTYIPSLSREDNILYSAGALWIWSNFQGGNKSEPKSLR